MSAAPQSRSEELLRRSLAAIEHLERRLAQAEGARRAPLAVVGIGCRYPGGVDGPDAFWRLLREGREALSPVPADRWAGPYAGPPLGGFVEGVWDFDPAFFGISPRECETLDPQQRLVLEVAWEALEHARIPPGALFGTAGGVFLGISTFDHALRLLGDPARRDAYAATGSLLSPAAGRLSYVLGLKGPSMAVDTACSSSLLAVHLACGALRNGECDLALAGGVNLMLEPVLAETFSVAGMLSPGCRCRAFDAAADGFVRAEGCGIVVLKRLDDALAAGDEVLGVIRGSAVNQDGRSLGLMAPNGPSQAEVVRRALSDAGARPDEVDFVETHGTGTALGDPIEAGALAEVFGPGRTRPLWLGALKSNIGHTEGASGIGGLIKALLALGHRQVPPHASFSAPSPHIPWDDVPLAVPRAPQPLDGAGPGLAGVSAFGFAGTNVHVVVQGPPPRAAAAPSRTEPAARVLVLSARTPAALRAQAERWAEHLAANPGLDLAAVAAVSRRGRMAMEHRAALVAESVGEAADRLRAFARGGAAAGVAAGAVEPGQAPPLVIHLHGDGGDAVRALRGTPAYEAAFERCADALREASGEGGDLIHRPEYAGAAAFARGWAALAALEAVGLAPAAVTGCGAGGWAAECRAGRVSPAEGVARALGAGAEPCTCRAPASGERGVWIGDAAPAGWVSPGTEGAPALLAALWVSGVAVEWARLDGGPLPPGVRLPPYAWQRTRYAPAPAAPPVRQLPRRADGAHPLLGAPVELAGTDEVRYAPPTGAQAPAFYAEHAVAGETVLPASVLVEMALAATAGGARVAAVEEIRFLRPVRLDGRELQGAVSRDGDAAGRFRLYGRAGGEPWALHAEARLRMDASAPAAVPARTGDEPAIGEAARSAAEAYYARAASRGFGFGPGFQRLQSLEVEGDEAAAWVRVPAESAPYRLHPLLWDAAFQVLDALAARGTEPPPLRVPAAAGGVRVHASAPEGTWLRIRARGAEGAGSVRLELADGTLVAAAEVETVPLDARGWEAAGARAPLFEVAWEPCGTLAPREDAPAALGRMAAEVEARAAALLDPELMARVAAARAALDARSRHHARRALASLLGQAGRDAIGGPVAAVADALGVEPGRHRLLSRVLEIAGAARTDGGWRMAAAALAEGAADGWIDDGRAGPEGRLLEQAGARLAEVLRGAVGAMEVLAPDGDLSLLEDLYHDAPSSVAAGRVAAQAFGALLAARGEGGPLRVLEVGAGTGGTTRALLGHLDPARVSYVFTDVGPSFLDRARARLGDPAGVEYRVLDVERPDESAVRGPFDVVVAANVLHATRDLRRVLRTVRGMLAPGGHLLLAEGVRTAPWVELTFGLTDGWTRHDDADLRPDGPLLSAARWREVLLEAGFQAAEPVGVHGGPLPLALPQVLVLARVPDTDVPAEWRIVQAPRTGDAVAAAASVLGALQAVGADARPPSRVFVVTRGAQPSADASGSDGAAQATALGLCRVAALEHPEAAFHAVDLAPGERLSAAELAEAARRAEGAEARVRGGTVHRRTVRPLGTRDAGAPAALDRGGTYLVAGGTSGLGAVTAEWLAARGAGAIVLFSRRGAEAVDDAWLGGVRRSGAEVRVLAADVADPRLAALLDDAVRGLPPVKGAVQAAGVLDDAVLGSLDGARLAAVIGPKLAGAANLARWLEGRAPDFFLLYSSAVGLFGNAGQGSHAAANAALDRLAAGLRASGLPATAIGWGPVGVPAAGRRPRAGFRGIAPLAARDAWAVLDRVVRDPALPAYLCAASGLPQDAPAPAAAASAGDAPASAADDALPARLAAAGAQERQEMLLAYVVRLLRDTLHFGAGDAVPTSRGLYDLGMDSLAVMELRARLRRELGVSLSATFAFSHPTPAALARHLAGLFGGAAESASSGSSASLASAGSPASAASAGSPASAASGGSSVSPESAPVEGPAAAGATAEDGADALSAEVALALEGAGADAMALLEEELRWAEGLEAR